TLGCRLRTFGASAGQGSRRVRDTKDTKEFRTGLPFMTFVSSVSFVMRLSEFLAGDAFVAVLRTELLEQRHRRREWRDALHRTVRHVGDRLAAARDGRDVRAFRHEVLN